MRNSSLRMRALVLVASMIAGLTVVPLALALPNQTNPSEKQGPAGESPVELPEMEKFIEFDVAPKLVSMEDPRYPKDARKAKLEGTVYVRVLVGTDGQVKKTAVVKSLPVFDTAAIESAKSAVFKPALVDQEPVAVWITIPFKFALK